MRQAVQLVQQLRPPQVIVVADRDEPKADGRRPGLDGAEALATVLLPYCLGGVRLILPPVGSKDVRQAKAAGMTAADVYAAIEGAPLRKLAVTGHFGRRGGHHGRR